MRALSLFGFASFLVLVLATACDFRPDQCEDDDNVCDGNVANQCFAPYAESRRETKRIDCGADRTCVRAAKQVYYDEHPLPYCVAKDPVACVVGSEDCGGGYSPRCILLDDGRTVCIDVP